MKKKCFINKTILLLFLFILSLSLRLWYLKDISKSPFFATPILDSAYYYNRATDILNGKFLANEPFFMSPLYPYFLASTYKIFGESQFSPRLVQIFIDLALVFIIIFFATSLFNIRAGFFAGLIAASCKVLIFYTDKLLDANITTLLSFISIYLLWNGIYSNKEERKRWICLVMGGIFGGLTAGFRPNTATIIPASILWIWLQKKYNTKTRVLYSTLILIGFLPLISLYFLHNFLVGNDLILISTNFGLNFYIGNNPQATGIYTMLDELDMRIDPKGKIPAERDLKRKLKDSEISRYWRNRAFEFIQKNPSKFLKLAFKKGLLFFNSLEVPQIYDFQFCKRYSSLLRFPLFLTFSVIGPLGLVGMVMNINRWRELSLLYLHIGGFLAVLMLVFVTSRYRLPVYPVFILFAGSAIDLFIQNLTLKRYKKIISQVFLLLLSFIFVNQKPPVRLDPSFKYAHIQLAQIYMRQGELEKAEEEVKYFLNVDPWNAKVHYNLALVYIQMGKLDLAEQELLLADKLNPSLLDPLFMLGGIAFEKKDLKMALAYYQKLYQIKPDYPRLNYNIGTIYLKMANFSEAIVYLTKALESDPKDPWIWNNLGIARAEMGDIQGAIGCFQKALELDPQNVEALKNLKQHQK